jgi:hypothetical protein
MRGREAAERFPSAGARRRDRSGEEVEQQNVRVGNGVDEALRAPPPGPREVPGDPGTHCFPRMPRGSSHGGRRGQQRPRRRWP